MTTKSTASNIFLFNFRFSHKKLNKDEMNKFFHDNEKFISEIKRKYGSTNLDKYYEEYLENKRKTKPRGYGNQKPNQINNLNELNEMFVANCIKDFPNNIFNLNVPINYMLMN